jgi:hypothetical protein
MEPRQIRILSFRIGAPCNFFGLAEHPSGFLFLTLHLQRLFAITFR